MAASRNSGIIYVADPDNHVIRKITVGINAARTIVETFAGIPGHCGYGDGMRRVGSLCRPWGLAVDHQDNIYFSDNRTTIRVITGEAGVYRAKKAVEIELHQGHQQYRYETTVCSMPTGSPIDGGTLHNVALAANGAR